MTTLLCKKKKTVGKSKEVKTEWSNSHEWAHPAEFSKVGCAPKKKTPHFVRDDECIQ
jgi:hypothetical protein